MNANQDIKALLRDVNLFFYGIELNHQDNGNVNELADSLSAKLQNGDLSSDDYKILPVFLTVYLDAVAKTALDINDDAALSPMQTEVIRQALAFAKDNPEFFNNCIAEVEKLRQEP